MRAQWGLLLLLCIAAATLAADPTVTDYRSHVDQARFFIKKGWLDDAHHEVMAAASDPNGRLDAEVWFLLTLLNIQRCDIAGARTTLANAQTYAKDQEQTTQILALKQQIHGGYGWLILPRGYQKKAVLLDSAGPIFDVATNEYLHRVRGALESLRTLPSPLALPVGSYTINGIPISIIEDETTTLIPHQTDTLRPKGYLKTSLGAGLWLNAPNRHLGGYGQGSLSAGLRHHWFVTELTVGWAPQRVTQEDGVHRIQWDAYQFSGEVGGHIEHKTLAFQWTFGIHSSRFQPIELYCSNDSSTASSCTTTHDEPLYVYPKIWTFGGFTAIRTEYRLPFGAAGLTVSPSFSAGRTKQSGTAQFAAESVEIEYIVDDKGRDWRSFGISLGLYARWDLQ